MDNFKDINDRYGHLAGDEILRNIGHLLQASIRHEDEAFRWGGDEFVILFHNQRPEVARKRMATSKPACAISACAESARCPSPLVGEPPMRAAAHCAMRWTKPTGHVRPQARAIRAARRGIAVVRVASGYSWSLGVGTNS